MHAWTVAVLVVVALAACAKRPAPGLTTKEAGAKEQKIANTDIKTLVRFINLPREPRSVRWETETQPGGNDWTLTALLAFEESDVQEILRSSEKLGGTAHVAADHLRSWFPASIRDKYPAASAPNAPLTIPVDGTRLTPQAFIAPAKSPLLHGHAIVFEKENLVYIHLFTM
jgi:hypothetical protein